MRSLTPQQAAVFAAVSHYHEDVGRPVPAAIVAEKLSITRQRVGDYFRRLYELGWLRGPGAPAVPARPMPPHEPGIPPLTKTQLPDARRACDLPIVAKRIGTVGTVALEQRTVEMPPLSFRADFAPQTVNEESRTVELTFTTGAPVQRYDWMSDKRYLETLSLDPEHVRLGRLNAGASLLDSHSAYSVADVLGAVVPDSAVLTKKEGRATVRFSKREAVGPVWQDVKDGIVSHVSVGYRVHKFEETTGPGNALPVRKAVDWEPYEISMVPMPADPGARVRDGGHSVDTNPCQIVGERAAVTEPPKKESSMKDKTRSEFVVEQDEDPPVADPAIADEPDERAAATTAERARCQGLTMACRAARLPQSYADKLISDGVTLVDGQTRVLEELAKRGGDDRGPSRVPSGGDVMVVGDDPLVHKRNGIEGALLHRLAPSMFKLDDQAREYRGMGLLDIAEVFLRAQGVRITSMSKMERAGAALGMSARAGMHTTSDFPSLLADVANKVLRAAYEAAPQTWVPISKPVPLSDFKASKQLQVGDAPQLLEVLEHGEFTSGTITEAKEEIQLKTYGRIFAITRQSLINDDTNAFAEVPASFGRAARTKESDLAWAQINLNGNMGDGKALFHSDHGNLAGSGGAISVTTIGAGRTAMRKQTAIDGVTLINLTPNYLIVPAAKETLADQFVSATLMASEPGKVNPFAGRLQVLSEPRLDATSGTAWYLATNPAQCPVLLYATLDGQTGPQVDQEIGFDVDGLKIKCRLDVAFKAADWRGIYKDPGA